MAISLSFDNRFARLPAAFYTKMEAEAFSEQPFLIHGNDKAARRLDLDPAAFKDPEFPLYFSGNKQLPGAEPLAMVYAGHQFGVYVPQLGDGRALLLGQVRNRRGELWDIQLKGAGLSPYSRFADGRAVLRSSIREYLCSEAMAALNIPTTRALCLLGTDEPVMREKLEPGAILTRLSPSHIRFGHFEYFYYRGQEDAVKELADHVIEEHFPTLRDAPDKYQQWFGEVVTRTAKLIAQWQAYGFAHGVMNTDNMSILGLTIDYGPFGFMERYDPGFIPNHSDTAGRYAFDQQPVVGLWNLYALANALQPLFPLPEAKTLIERYAPTLGETYDQIMATKLGISNTRKDDEDLWQELLALMKKHGSDYTLTFRRLSACENDEGSKAWFAAFKGTEEAKSWLARWKRRVAAEGNKAECQKKMASVNPKYVLRNWVAETAIRAAEDHHDYNVLDHLFKIVQSPYEEHPDAEGWASLPPPEMQGLCVSCSS